MANVSDFLSRQQPQQSGQEVGIGGFTVFARVSDSYKLTADAPDIYLEDGTAISDHIILKPLSITITGDVSDVHVRRDPIISGLVRALAEIGNVSSQYASPATQSQIARVASLINTINDTINAAGAAIDAGTQAIEFFGNADAQTKSTQEKFLDAMEAIHFGKQLIDIDMPFRRHTNMVITAFTSSTDNEADSTTFTIEAKKVSFTGLQYVEVEQPAPGVGGQLDKEAAKGSQEGKKAEISLLGHILG